MGGLDVTVVLALYNGEKWLSEQIESILFQLEGNDELVIVDDCSTDLSLSIVKSFDNSRIKIIQNNVNQGHVKTFIRGIKDASNEYVFLSDQDDIWLGNRLPLMKKILAKNSIDLLVTQYTITKKQTLTDLRIEKKISSFKVLIDIFLGRDEYFGCTYALKRSAFVALPVYDWVLAHDLAIAMYAAIKAKKIYLSRTPTVFRRIHGSNLTASNTRIIKKVKNRIWMLRYLLEVSLRY